MGREQTCENVVGTPPKEEEGAEEKSGRKSMVKAANAMSPELIIDS